MSSRDDDDDDDDDQEGPGLNTLIVVTSSPLLWRSASSSSCPATAATTAAETREQQGGEAGRPGQGSGAEKTKRRSPLWRHPVRRPWRSPPPSWSAHPREAASLLSLLFSWAHGGEGEGEGDGEGESGGDERAAPSTAPVTAHVRAAKEEASGVAGDGRGHASEASLLRVRSANAAAKERERASRIFSIVCPATRVRTNLETYVRDGKTGRVAVQWCLASKESGEANSLARP